MRTATVDSDKRTRTKALAVLREGRCTIRNAWPADNDQPRAAFVDALVVGFKGSYDITLRDGLWVCSSCGPGTCSHTLAAQLVTGWGSPPSARQAASEPPPAQAAVTGPWTAPCRHGMTPQWCADCTGRDGGEAELSAEHQQLLRQRHWTPAMYDGACCYCGEPFAKQTPIRLTPADVRGWAGPCCGQREGGTA